jgi:SOS response regulatory protein OraA/RecX
VKPPQRPARELALARLSVREYGSLEMIQYLESKAIDTRSATEVVGQLVDEKLLDDERYVRSVIRNQARLGKGPDYILSRLQQKGVKIERSEVNALLGEITDCNELDRARKILNLRYPKAQEKGNEKEIRRAQAGLLRRGFSADTVRELLPTFLTDDE